MSQARRNTLKSVALSALLMVITAALVTASSPESGGMGVTSSGYVTTLFVEPIGYQTSGSYYDASNQLRSAAYTFHHGVDISGGCVAGTYPVYAVASGTVAVAQYISDGYGSQVIVDHGYNVGNNGRYTYTFYSHMGNRSNGARYIVVSPGQYVRAGDIVGYQGNDGSTYGSCPPDPGTHVDWEVRVSDTPLQYNTTMRYRAVAASQNFYTYQQLTYGLPNPLSRVTAGPFNNPPPSPTATPGPCGMRFSDVPDTYWAYQYIAYLYCRNIIGGYSDGTFRPENPLTRGQFSKMVALGHGWNLFNPYFPTFTDVPPSHTFYVHIETAKLRDIVVGYPDGTFRPGNDVTRGQATKMVVLAHGWALTFPPSPTFWDVPPGHWAYGFVETAVRRGVVDRQPNGSFGPNTVITRAELCKILALTLQQGLQPGDPGPKLP